MRTTPATRVPSALDAMDIRSALHAAALFGDVVPALPPLAGLALRHLERVKGAGAESHAHALATLANAINLLVNDPRRKVPAARAALFELVCEDAAEMADAASRLLRAVERRRVAA